MSVNYFVDKECRIQNFKSSNSETEYPVSKELFQMFNCESELEEKKIYDLNLHGKISFENQMTNSLLCLENSLNEKIRSEVPLNYYSLVKATNEELDSFTFKNFILNKEYDGSGELVRGPIHFSKTPLNFYDGHYVNQGNLTRKMEKEGFHNFRIVSSHPSYDADLTMNRESMVLRIQNSASNRDFNSITPQLTIRPNCLVDNQMLKEFGICILYDNYLEFKRLIPCKFL